MSETQPMSEAMYYALLALAEPGHGYAVMQRVRALSGGWRWGRAPFTGCWRG